MTSDRERQLAALVMELIAAFDSGAPVEELETRVFRYHCIQISLPGTCSPLEPKAESI